MSDDRLVKHLASYWESRFREMELQRDVARSELKQLQDDYLAMNRDWGDRYKRLQSEKKGSMKEIERQTLACPDCNKGSIWDVPLIDMLPAGHYISCRECGCTALVLAWAATGALIDIAEREQQRDKVSL